MYEQAVTIDVGGAAIAGDLRLPEEARGVVVFAHGSGSSRHSPRNKQVAQTLNEAGIGTLLVDLLTADEEQVDLQTRELRFDIDLNRRALDELTVEKQLEVVPQATHLFEEPGALEQVAELARNWFTRWLDGGSP